MKILYPEQYAESAAQVDYEALRQKDVRLLMFDVDNTLETYNTTLPSRETRQWVRQLKKQGFQIVLVSNGAEKRVERFAASLGVSYVYRALKPLPVGIRKALDTAGCRPMNAALIGDQIFTDVLGANWAGVHAILTKPLSTVDDEWITRIKRGLERKVIARYLRKEGKRG